MGELHLVIIWENGRHKEDEIVSALNRELTILKKFDIGWSAGKVLTNFRRFYGVKLSDAVAKVKDCGAGRFLAISVWDENPEYSFEHTSRGMEYVNKKLFQFKQKCRDWAGGSTVHTSNSVTESNHDLVLLLGQNSRDYLNTLKNGKNPAITRLDQDLIGTNGWRDLKELFYILNNTIDYVVLRNFENLPESCQNELHGDIDLLVENLAEAALILNAARVFAEPYRVHYRTKVGDAEVFFDLRHLGDDYYCQRWEKECLKYKSLNKNNIYVPDRENYFYTLVYHALIHKSCVAPDYYSKMDSAAKDVNLDCTDSLSRFQRCDQYFLFLNAFMKKNNYHFVRPADRSVAYRDALPATDDAIEHIIQVYPQISGLAPYALARAIGSGGQFFRGTLDDLDILVKWGKVDEFIKNECLMALRLVGRGPRNFLKPLLFKYNSRHSFIVYPFINGHNLAEIIDQLSDSDRGKIIFQIKEIAETLLKTSICHRDIHLENLFFSDDGDLLLLDPQFAVKADRYEEMKTVRRDLQRIRQLGRGYALGKFKWDDSHSLRRVLDKLGPGESCQEVYDLAANYLDRNIGKFTISFTAKSYARLYGQRLKHSFLKRLKKMANAAVGLLGATDGMP